MTNPFSLHSFKKRLLALSLLVTFLFCALSVRLFVVQIINGKDLQLKATSQWTRDLAITAPRGDIYDVTGSRLATSYTTYNVYVRGREIENPEQVSKFLSDILSLDYLKVFEKVIKKNISEVLIKLQVSADVAEEIYRQKFSGVYLAESVGRYYTYGNLLSQTLGFVSVDNVGQSGIESQFDALLKGADGYSFTQSDLQGKEIGGALRYYVPATKGADIRLTVDSKIQLILEQALEKIMTEQKAKNATGLVMNAKTAEVLAISTKPSFDLNNIPRDDITKLFDESKIKAITDVYEPGSTFKILTLAAALEEGVVSENDRFYCGGSRVIDGVKIRCWRSIGHGSQDLQEGLANSCNCVFMELAMRLGVDKFYDYMQKFGLGQKTGVSLAGEVGGILMDKSIVKRVDLARMGFGHAVAVTPIQLLTAVDGIVNGGKLTTPTIVSEAVDVFGNQIYHSSHEVKRQVVSQSTSQRVCKLLSKATNKHGDYTFVEGYDVGGKTGTAQKYDATGHIAQGKYISSFIGTFPAADPDYLVMVMVDEPSAGAYYGSVVAAPYGKEIFSGIFKYLDIKKQNETTIIELVEMPDLVGKTLTDAAIELKKLGISFETDGEGGIVLKQLPPAGTKVAKGDTIILIT